MGAPLGPLRESINAPLLHMNPITQAEEARILPNMRGGSVG